MQLNEYAALSKSLNNSEQGSHIKPGNFASLEFGGHKYCTFIYHEKMQNYAYLMMTSHNYSDFMQFT